MAMQFDYKEAAAAVGHYLTSMFGPDNVRLNPGKRLTIIEVRQDGVWRAVLAVGSPPRPGKGGRDFLGALRGKEVIVTLHEGTAITGVLAGYNAYDILVKCPAGHRIVFKNFVTCVEPATGEPDPFAEQKKEA